jgi:galactokinase
MVEDALSPAERLRLAVLRDEVACAAGARRDSVQVVRSPYRACPLGAHVDHQLGRVTGMALDRALLLGFVPSDDGLMAVRSRQYPGEVRFGVAEPPARPAGDWADYVRGAAWALARKRRLTRGVRGVIDGYENVGGLSSSAATGVACLLALERVNELDLTPSGNVELDRVLENEFIGLSNGILDQSVILLGRPGHLTVVDCRSGEGEQVPFGGAAEPLVVALFSGLGMPLTTSDYNLRVDECRRAAGALLKAGGLPMPDAPVLRAVPPEAFAEHGGALPERLRRRSAHFFGEQERVARGVELWRAGDLAGFGRLVSESGRSSVENYECGNSYLVAAYEALCGCPGVYGARFSGAGFRGCCIGLAEAGREEDIACAALGAYLSECPDMTGEAEVFFCRSAPGACIIE